jgi:hypothetical protein
MWEVREPVGVDKRTSKVVPAGNSCAQSENPCAQSKKESRADIDPPTCRYCLQALVQSCATITSRFHVHTKGMTGRRGPLVPRINVFLICSAISSQLPPFYFTGPRQRCQKDQLYRHLYPVRAIEFNGPRRSSANECIRLRALSLPSRSGTEFIDSIRYVVPQSGVSG